MRGDGPRSFLCMHALFASLDNRVHERSHESAIEISHFIGNIKQMSLARDWGCVRVPVHAIAFRRKSMEYSIGAVEAECGLPVDR